MDITNPVIGFSKDFGPTVWRYVKYQICHNNYVSDFQKTQKQLKDRKDVIEAHLRTALMQRGKIENKEVRAWLDDAQREIAEEVIEDLICKGGCFTYICSSIKLDKKTRALCKEIFERGEKYTNGGEILVMDDHSIQNRRSVFEDMQKEAEHQKEKIEADLKTQLRQPGKIAWNKVEDWLKKASQQVNMKVEDLISQGECSSSTNIKDKIEELKQTLEEGKEFTNVGVSLVIDDHSKKGLPMPAEKCIARDEVQEEILQLLRGDKFTRIAVCGMGGVGKTAIMKQVHNQLLKEPTKEVIWVKVSKDFDIVLQQKRQFDILKFQKSIARKLGCGLNEDEDLIEHAKRISQSLQQRSYVLILDDVWEPFSLEDVGILDSVGNDACKLVLTTRLQQKVAREMRCKEIYVKPLSDVEALALFLHKVESDLKSHPRFRSDVEPFLNQILKKCNGLPLAIGVVATNIEEKTEELKRLLEKGKEFTSDGVSLVVDDHSKKGVTMLAEKCIARDDVQEEILQLLRGDKVTRIAVCGMGGVGKTTVMKQVYKQLLKEPKFDNVIWVKVSKDFNMVVQQKTQFDILKFQKSIARKLGLDLKNADQDAIELAGLISDTLQRGSLVLILDDVWEPFSLEDVGILDSVGNDICKLVLTTRLQQKVAREMRCKETYVKPLSEGEALALFLDKVESDLKSHPRFRSDIEQFLKQILKKCDGLPLAIGAVAKTMRGKFDRYSWEMADKELSKSKEIVDCLKFSYDHLEEQYKKCFLYCALYHKDHEIPKEELIEFWIEEGFIIDERGSRHSMICAGHVILEKLIDNCMLELVKNKHRADWMSMHELVENKNKEDRVSMHDLFREMALKISPQFMVKAGMALEELPEEHEWREDLLKVSLMNNNIREIPSSMSSPKCPMLTTLLLSNNNITTIPEAFFDRMLGLKILDLSNNYELGRLSSSVSKLENLTTLLLENCESLKEVPSLSNLEGLKKLNLFGTSIEELPQGLSMLTNLKYLWLDGKLSDIPDELLGNLSKLQYFRVGWTIPLKWEEIRRLRKLESLDGCFSTLDDMSLFVKSERKFLNQYRIFVGSYSKDDYYYYKKTFSDVMKLIVCCDIDICEEPNWLPSDAQGFYIKYCNDVRSLDDISGFQEATDLRHCTVERCDGLEFVVSSRCLKPLQNLESLNLYDWKELNAVIGEVEAVAKSAPLPAGTFSSLRKIEVFHCGKIKKLLPLRLLRYLQNLRTIKVIGCVQMEEIIWSDYEEEKAPKKLTLPKLERVRLEELPTLKSIYSGSSTVLICDSLKRIQISNCPKIESVFWAGFNPLPTLEHLLIVGSRNLKSVFDEEVLGLSAPPSTFFSLKTIYVASVLNLKKVFSSGWLLGYFQSLETIRVSRCKQMEELISSSTYEEKEAVEQITLPNLQRLELNCLSKLMSICSSSSVLICDSIKSLAIHGCNNLKRIPLHFSLLDNGQPPSLKQILVNTKRRWESLEWDQSNAKDVLLPFVNFTMSAEEEEMSKFLYECRRRRRRNVYKDNNDEEEEEEMSFEEEEEEMSNEDSTDEEEEEEEMSNEDSTDEEEEEEMSNEDNTDEEEEESLRMG